MNTAFAKADVAGKWLGEHGMRGAVPLGATGIPVSPAGFGCYRVDANDATHRAAMEKALLAGVNLFDTSSNYGDGGSEWLVGSVIHDLCEKGSLDREAVVVVSKVGYLQGNNLRVSAERMEAGNPFSDLVLYGRGIQHCIHPEFLEDQLARSLERLQMDHLDGYLLHNPEYYLTWAAGHDVPLEEARAEFYRRVEGAFGWLEEQVATGRIGFYGVSSNTIPAPSEQADFVSVSEIWDVAERVSANHHLRVVEFPMNLFEPGGAIEGNQPGGGTVLDFAREKNLGVLINRPLNAIRGQRLTRLADVPAGEVLSDEEIEGRLRDLTESEEALKTGLLKSVKMPRTIRQQVKEFIVVGEPLLAKWKDFESYDQWREVQTQWLLPRVNGVLHYLVLLPNAPRELHQWVDGHVDRISRALDGVTSMYAPEAARRAADITAMVEGADVRWQGAGTLSRAALRALRSTEGISSVLVGMRHPRYVDDVLAELARPVERAAGVEAWRTLSEEL